MEVEITTYGAADHVSRMVTFARGSDSDSDGDSGDERESDPENPSLFVATDDDSEESSCERCDRGALRRAVLRPFLFMTIVGAIVIAPARLGFRNAVATSAARRGDDGDGVVNVVEPESPEPYLYGASIDPALAAALAAMRSDDANGDDTTRASSTPEAVSVDSPVCYDEQTRNRLLLDAFTHTQGHAHACIHLSSELLLSSSVLTRQALPDRANATNTRNDAQHGGEVRSRQVH